MGGMTAILNRSAPEDLRCVQTLGWNPGSVLYREEGSGNVEVRGQEEGECLLNWKCCCMLGNICQKHMLVFVETSEPGLNRSD